MAMVGMPFLRSCGSATADARPHASIMRVMVSPRHSPCPIRAWSCSSARPGAASPRSPPGTSRRPRCSRRTPTGERVSGDAADQRPPGGVRRAARRPVGAACGSGCSGRGRDQRAGARAAAARSGARLRPGSRSVAIVLDLPEDLVLARNAARADRVVPEDVVRRQLADAAAGRCAPGRLEAGGLPRDRLRLHAARRRRGRVRLRAYLRDVRRTAPHHRSEQPAERPRAHLHPDAVLHVDVLAARSRAPPPPIGADAGSATTRRP